MIQINAYGPWAVVTGASSGIGEGFAHQLAAAGLNLVLAARSADKLEALGAALAGSHGISYRAVAVDLSLQDAATTLIEATEDLDVGLLVSNAGTGVPGRFLDQEITDLRRRLVLNAGSHLELVHAFGRRFAARGRGGMVLVSALGAAHGIPNMAQDSSAKGYLLHLGETLHHELARDGVAVTVAMPGNVDTPIIDKLGFARTDLPVRPQPVEKAVREMIAAFLKGRATHVPGRMMRTMARLMPRSQSIRMNGRMLGKAARNLAEREQVGA
ncbi:SDR family NAD(P)-dependent oxidoreductase [Myceligenerans pegani]|uniref:SDR family NAD(P)-dependent oxidoreductase n=1 Tax=Myceligenerans pegani TaxID=2776917 RepID=A0ABR9N4S3_9MICO|nr:SDR family NAD(P)-dependent oxidoreductase [Myceligenerans sp. TRM 65318]MBE1878078.1 SDR family NAD(P)-dependent oxidoreductase [Myceligenerans sp. TRM 65318]MBE3020349.1 SDR family NAD(P)-dependent oxidoreductase [Myceligenerans sp. TRM 65318]